MFFDVLRAKKLRIDQTYNWVRGLLFIRKCKDPSFVFPEGDIFEIDPWEHCPDSVMPGDWQGLSIYIISNLKKIPFEVSPRDHRKALLAVNSFQFDSPQMKISLEDADAVGNPGSAMKHTIKTETGKATTLVVGVFDKTGHPFRSGTKKLEEEDLAQIHPLALSYMKTLPHPSMYDLAFYHPKLGMRFGIMGWSSSKFKLGELLGLIFSKNRELYDDPATKVFIDQYGRLCNYTGWFLSLREACSTPAIFHIVKLLSKHSSSQIEGANRAVNRFIEDRGKDFMARKIEEDTKEFADWFENYYEDWLEKFARTIQPKSS